MLDTINEVVKVWQWEEGNEKTDSVLAGRGEAYYKKMGEMRPEEIRLERGKGEGGGVRKTHKAKTRAQLGDQM